MVQVFIRPNGPVPVLPLEWRIKEDVPTNLNAVKAAAEKLYTVSENYTKRRIIKNRTKGFIGYNLPLASVRP